jgi:GH25 family lysozyme M1 (1,4-beta-N-acetylmuramidase)
VANHWWLDVETANSWRDDPRLNVAALQGAVDYLESMEVAGVGFYSAPRMWSQITADTTAFSDYPSWVAGASTLDGAEANCGGDGFTGGGVELAQYLSGGFDANHLC